jgi:hypothetical protein
MIKWTHEEKADEFDEERWEDTTFARFTITFHSDEGNCACPMSHRYDRHYVLYDPFEDKQTYWFTIELAQRRAELEAAR